MNTSYERISAQDELDLVALLNSLWKGKWFIMLMMALLAVTATVYVTLKRPMYLAKMTLIPPIVADISLLNRGRTNTGDLKPVSPGEAFNVFRGVLLAESTLNLFKKNRTELLDLKNDSLKSMSINPYVLGYTVIAEATSRQVAADAVMEFVALTKRLALEKLNATLMKESQAWGLQNTKEGKLSASYSAQNQLPRLPTALQQNNVIEQDQAIDLARLDGDLSFSDTSVHHKRFILLAGILGGVLGIVLLIIQQIRMLRTYDLRR